MFQFQSHIGAIRILFLIPFLLSFVLFQSHIGAIRMNPAIKYAQILQTNFNPTLVQLESTCHYAQSKRRTDFNPTLVQLELSAVE